MITKITAPLITLMLLVSSATKANESLELVSTAFSDGESLPVQFTCEGVGISPPLYWSGVPDGTQTLVVIMDHMPDHMSDLKPKPNNDNKEENTPPEPKLRKPEELRWYWSMYNIPAQVSGIETGQSAGTLGSNIVNNKNEYSPPCSKGPGQKNYTFHLYALSKSLDTVQSGRISESILREKMSGFVLESDSLTVRFERSCQTPPKPHQKQSSHQEEKRDPPSTLRPCGQTKGELIPVFIEEK